MDDQYWVDYLNRYIQQNLQKSQDDFSASLRAAVAAEERVADAILDQQSAAEEWERKQRRRAQAQANQATYHAAVHDASKLLSDLQDRVAFDWQRTDDAAWNANLRRVAAQLREIRPEKQSALYNLRALYASGTSPLPRRLLDFGPLMFALGELESQLEYVASLRELPRAT